MDADPITVEGITFCDLQSAEGLRRVDEAFLAQVDEDVRIGVLAYREAPAPPAPLLHSAFLLDLAPRVEAFLSRLFGIETAVSAARSASRAHDPVLELKRHFVQRRARRHRDPINESFAELDVWLERVLRERGWDGNDRELAVAHFAVDLLHEGGEDQVAAESLTRWCVLALKDPAGRRHVADWVSFRVPQPTDPGHLVDLRDLPGDPAGRVEGVAGHQRRRDGFGLTDPRMSPREVQGEVHYCVYCHAHDGDFCSKGFPEKKDDAALGFRVNALDSILTGCPLEEKISEMHTLKREGYTIASLALAMVDNPLVPATGHRICNDCMKACIYQKQDPVNIPQIETRVLTDVLDLPWGVEIYDLLTRWNPLRHRQYVLKPFNGRKVLIAGMGPAGFAMAHHLTMEGCAVVGIDGLKIEPLPEALLSGAVRRYADLAEPLESRVNYGFGGVAEYGITVRWDKNFLKLIYLSLARRATFQVFGGVRLGGTVTLEDAWQLGFDHVCIACGAGLPRVVPMTNSLARGMRQASDFLMALQLTGAAKSDSLASLQVRLPALVIGGGLTAIDTATELQAYYIAQVEKVADRYERLVQVCGEDQVLAGLDEENQAVLREFLAHGRAIRAERQGAAAVGEPPNFMPLLHRWGGVTVVYRRGLNESPAYLRNHEEVAKALEEGIYYAQGLDPVRAELDRHGHVKALVCRRRERHEGRWLTTEEEVRLPARGIYVAAGALPNTIYEREHPDTFTLEGGHYLPHVHHQQGLQPVQPVRHCKEPEFGPFTSYQRDGHRVTFIGDTHPAFHGSVVRAIASALRTYPHIMGALAEARPSQVEWLSYRSFRARMEELLSATVDTVRLDHPGVVELWVRAPMAAHNFRPGQFFRLQTFERLSSLLPGTRLQIPLQTVSGAGVQGDRVRLFLLRGGANARLAAALAPGTPVVLMGPTGTPSHIGRGRTVMVIAGQWGAAVMIALGPALRAAGNRVLYFASFRSAGEVYCQDELEAAADRVVWSTVGGSPVVTGRAQDVSVVGADLVDLIGAYGAGDLESRGEHPSISLWDVDEILVMGSTGLLKNLQKALRVQLRGQFRPEVRITGTVGSPMQCMLKGVCAQCLQWQVDPETGSRTRAVFSCAMQDQPLLWLDLSNLAARQAQNRLQDHLTNLWLSQALNDDGAPRGGPLL